MTILPRSGTSGTCSGCLERFQIQNWKLRARAVGWKCKNGLRRVSFYWPGQASVHSSYSKPAKGAAKSLNRLAQHKKSSSNSKSVEEAPRFYFFYRWANCCRQMACSRATGCFCHSPYVWLAPNSSEILYSPIGRYDHEPCVIYVLGLNEIETEWRKPVAFVIYQGYQHVYNASWLVGKQGETDAIGGRRYSDEATCLSYILLTHGFHLQF